LIVVEHGDPKPVHGGTSSLRPAVEDVARGTPLCTRAPVIG
jgi:hypothetical protein